MWNKKTTEDYVRDAISIHNEKYDYTLVDYVNNKTKVEIICKEHGSFLQNPKNHLNGSGCPKCAKYLRRKAQSKTTPQIIQDFIEIHNNRYDYSLVNYVNNKTKVDVICPEHGSFPVIPSHHLNNIGCSKCSNNYRRTTEEYILKCNEIHDNKYDYSVTKFKSCNNKIEIICPEHGVFYQNAGHHLRGHGCSKCSSSKGEKEIYEFLLDNKIEFIKEKTFEDCLSKKGFNLRFDFYLPEYNMLIEYDGIQHFKPIEYFGGEEYLKEVKESDDFKNNYCYEKGIQLIRITYNQNLQIKLQKIKTTIMKNT